MLGVLPVCRQWRGAVGPPSVGLMVPLHLMLLGVCFPRCVVQGAVQCHWTCCGWVGRPVAAPARQPLVRWCWRLVGYYRRGFVSRASPFPPVLLHECPQLFGSPWASLGLGACSCFGPVAVRGCGGAWGCVLLWGAWGWLAGAPAAAGWRFRRVLC